MATARRPPVAFVQIAGNGLDAFDTEIVAPRPQPVSAPPAPAGPPILEVVAAYSDPSVCPDAWRSAGGPRLTLRRVVRSSFHLARTLARFPLVVLSWILLRIWWVVRLAVTSVWQILTATVRLVGDVLAAIGRAILDTAHGVIRALVGAMTTTARGVVAAGVYVGALFVHACALCVYAGALCVYAGTLCAYAGARITGAAAAATLGARQAVTGACGALTRVARTGRSAAAEGGRQAIGMLNITGALLGRTATTLARCQAVGFGRGLARSAAAFAAASAAMAYTALATSKTRGAQALGTSATHARRAIASSMASAARNSRTVVAVTARSAHVSSAAALRRAERTTIRMAVADMPIWARQTRPVPVLAVLLAATVAMSVGIAAVLLAPRHTARLDASPADPLAQAPSPPPVVLAVASVKGAASPVQPAVARRAARRPLVTSALRTSALRTSAGASTRAARASATRSGTPGRAALSAATIRDIWARTDTRSLDRALASLRSATLAFQRCEMHLTTPIDTAVAQCDEVPARVAWTFHFHRDDGRWLIDGLASGRRGQP